MSERRVFVGSTDSGRAALRFNSSVGVCLGYKLVCTHLFVFEFDRRDEGEFRYMSCWLMVLGCVEVYCIFVGLVVCVRCEYVV